MIKWFYGGNSAREVSSMFGVKYPNRPIPASTTVNRIIRKLETAGTLLNNCKCNKDDRNLRQNEENENTFNVLATVAKNPNASIRQIAKNIGLHHSRVLRILKKHKYHSYKYHFHQELRENDFVKRNTFCFQMMEKCNENREILKNILFTDECTFTLHNEPNVQNCRVWSTENPNIIVETRTQYPQKVNVWTGIIGHHIIGPFFFK